MNAQPTTELAQVPQKALESRFIVGTRVDATSYEDAVDRCISWAREGESRYVCVSTVHMVMEGHDSPAYQHVVNSADLVTPDGVPLVWALRWLGIKGVTRVYGPELTPQLLKKAADRRIPVGFFGGGTQAALDRLVSIVQERFPHLVITYAYAPPFHPLSPDEDETIVREITDSGARVLFVGLGCPKQERWMHEHRGRLPAVMVGVGAAFDFLAGVKPQAPRLVQKMGMEWLFRLATEPRRLWKRYLKHNPRFVFFFLLQVLGVRQFAPIGAIGLSEGTNG
ncbi:MAG TPA: WecB/TagA/CpsF family glycosyltransferase [Candidatus Latescibacteria bacterium]|nr:WecB/TagA/CpsF family glycosyltransferase [Candidatus Latescibacterota bacterium]HOS64358.1 WecB/TagA/CpsF family glycosyltransferase [Candidatus Latescibacterota bacterium]HPK75775.1 WecB/TagA/CpsF family glycosyltransferase [Candidatus Latescibacterota bacterium]